MTEITGGEGGNGVRVKKFRGDSAEEYKLFKKEADGYILGLPETVPESKHGVKLYNLLDKGTEKEQTPVGELMEPYGPRDFLGEWGLTKLWGILDEAYPDKPVMQEMEEALEGQFAYEIKKDEACFWCYLRFNLRQYF